MKKVIVTTTIYPPNEAIEKFDSMKDWTLVVIGDLKTPKDYTLKNGIYVSPGEQEKYDKELSDLIGWNKIMRRNFGFLWAKDMGADIIATVDDDNIPLEGWGENLVVGSEVEMDYYKTELDCFDPIAVTNYPHLWHRGFPVQLLSQRSYTVKEKKKVKVDIEADFWNGDPDIDAICRLEHAPECQFDDQIFPFAANRISPFNSQNTFLTKDVLKDYFILPYVGRMDDIWASYHVQSLGYSVAYCQASVYQNRNPQDLTRNLVDEFLGYEKTISLVKSINARTYDCRQFWPEQTWNAYQAYKRNFEK